MWHTSFSNQLSLFENVLQFRKLNISLAPKEAIFLLCWELSPAAAAARTQAAAFTHGNTEACRSRWSSTSREGFLWAGWRREASPSHSADGGNLNNNTNNCRNTFYIFFFQTVAIRRFYLIFEFVCFFARWFFHELIFASNSILCLFERFCLFISVCKNPSGNISTGFYNCAVFTLMTHSAGKSDIRSDPSSALTVAL